MAANNTANTANNTPVSRSSADGEFSIRSAYERESRRAGSFDTSTSFASRSSLMSDTSAKPQTAAKKTTGAKFAVGDAVQHKVFGAGTVVNVTPVAGDMLVEVQFASATKKMMANYAPLTKVE